MIDLAKLATAVIGHNLNKEASRSDVMTLSDMAEMAMKQAMKEVKPETKPTDIKIPWEKPEKTDDKPTQKKSSYIPFRG